MALVLKDRVKETTTTTGTGTITLAGVSLGYQAFSVIGDGNTTYYCIAGRETSEFEVGIGTYTLSGTTLSRDTILSSSNAGSAVNFSAGTKDVFVVYPAGKSVNLDASDNATFPAGTVALPSITTSGDTNTGVWFPAADTVAVSTAGTERMRIDSSGNVGIGSVNGLDKLHVYEEVNSAIATQLLLQNQGAGSNTAGIAFQVTSLAEAALTVYAPKAAIIQERTASYGRGPIKFMQDNAADADPFDAGDEVMRIDSSGNVGIGTSSPSSALSVARSSGEAVISISNSGTASSWLTLSPGSSGVGYIHNTGNTSTVFTTNGAEAMRIDSSGNVGIGTSSPQSSLQVSGAMPVSPTGNGIHMGITSSNTCMQFNAGSGNVSLIDFSTSGTDSLGRLLYDNTSNYLSIGTNSAERMRIDSSGNVGIGTTTTTRAVLNIDTDGSNTAKGYGLALTNTAGGGATWALQCGDYAVNNGTFTIRQTGISGTTRFAIDTSGNVGIGTTSPANTLDVTGTIGAINVSSSTGTNYAKVQVNNTGGSFQFGIENSAGSNYGAPAYSRVLWNDGAYPNVFYTNSTERMRIDSSGNLLVGTTNALAKLTLSWPSASQQGFVLQAADVSFAGSPIIFYNSASGISGYIGQTTSTISYNTSSDYRLKEAIAPMTGALAKVALLKPCTYKWKVDGSDGQGFIAHELQVVVPECIAGEKDALNEDGSIKPQGIDTSFLVATLTAAIQELKAIIDTQATRIAALEAKA
jgi:hypothetical protein